MIPTVIITGAAGNLGRSVTQKMLYRGFRVDAPLGPNDDPGFLDHEHLHTESVNLLEEDLTRDYIERVADWSDELRGGILLVGGFTAGNLSETDSATVEKMFNLNFKTAYHSVRPLLKVLEKQNRAGQIVLVGSGPALQPEVGKDLVAYSLSKSLIFRLAELVNAQYKASPIQANVVVPGTLDTPVNRKAMPGADFSKWVQPDQIADAIFAFFDDPDYARQHPVVEIYERA